ncbi:MAG: flavin reductase family protein [Clostridiales bacterium]|nr:flavin reductase family protein [Clostridiales bacterium]
MLNEFALHKLNYGLYVASSGDSAKANAQICNTAFQITSDPKVLAVSINKQNYTHELIAKTGKLALSILDTSAPFEFIGKFGFRSGRTEDKLGGESLKAGTTGVPIVLSHACGYIECEVADKADLGTHTLFFGKVVECDILTDADPMTYDYYHKVIKGKAPRTAPTFIESE